MRVAKKMKCDKRKSKDRPAMLLNSERRPSASRSSANLRADYRSRALKNNTPKPRDAQADLPLCRFALNDGGDGFFFLCIEEATGDSVFPQRETLARTMPGDDVEIYRGLLRQREEELEAAEAEQAAGGHVFGVRVSRARALVSEMEF